MLARFELAEKLRAQLRDLEKEKRELARRYKEQVGSLDLFRRKNDGLSLLQ